MGLQKKVFKQKFEVVSNLKKAAIYLSFIPSNLTAANVRKVDLGSIQFASFNLGGN
jgi:hypothetical protein